MSPASKRPDPLRNSSRLNVLFFLEPREDLGDPLFRYPTLRNSFLPQIERLRAEGHSTHVLLGTDVAREATADGVLKYMGHCSVLGLPEPMASEPASVWFEEPPDSRLMDWMQEHVRVSLPPGYCPDVIIVWESPCPYLAALFPDATVIQQWPGFFSRPPFPELVAFDTGLVHQSAAVAVAEAHGHGPATPEIVEPLSRLRIRDRPLLEDAWPMPGLLARWRRRFHTLVLVPLQVDDYFAVTEVLPDGQRQLDWLRSLLESTPEGVGLVVTQYVSKRQASDVLDDERVDELRAHYPGFLHDRRFDVIPWCSQLLAPRLDGVITLSSSLGWQAAYWHKPLFCAGPSHLTPFITSEELAEFFEQAMSGASVDRDAVLGAILPRMHVPMRRLADEPGFLAGWLRALHARKFDGGLAADNWPLADNPRAHLDGWLEWRREREFGVAFGSRNLTYPRPERSFWTTFADTLDEVDVVSFDIFDTLIERPLANPIHVFDWMTAAVREELGRPELDFRAARRAAESVAFERARERGEGETTLIEIYEALGEELVLDAQALERLVALELATEARFLRPRAAGMRALAMARERGRRVILLSDMYLPRAWIEQRLRALGVEGWEELFVSSETRHKKHDGALFRWVEERLHLPPTRFLHVGDNRIGDVQRPLERGWKALHLRRSVPELRRSLLASVLPAREPGPQALFTSLAEAAMAQGLYDEPDRAPESEDSPCGGVGADLGFATLGPLLLGFSRWLYETARLRGYTHLYFLARDGAIMKRAYDIYVAGLTDAPGSTFLLCSRRAVNVASLEERADVFELLDVDFAPTPLGSFLEHRFGLARSDLDLDTMEDLDLSLDSKVGMGDRPRIRELLERISPLILQNAARERAAYLEYLGGVGIAGNRDAAVVDIGYAGTMQASLRQILGSTRPLGGLYLLTFDTARDRATSGELSMEGYLGHLVDHRSLEHPVPRRVPVYETLFSSESTSFDHFEKRENALEPHFAPALAHDQERAALITEVQAGAIRFVEQTSALARDLPASSWPPPLEMLRPLSSFVTSPSAGDAVLFVGVAFEDVYGGRESRYLIPPLDRLDTEFGLWSEGQEAINDQRRSSPGRRLLAAAREIVARALLVPLVEGLAPRFLNPRKLWKLRHEPAAFFADARQPWVQRMGRLYVDASAIRSRGR